MNDYHPNPTFLCSMIIDLIISLLRQSKNGRTRVKEGLKTKRKEGGGRQEDRYMLWVWKCMMGFLGALYASKKSGIALCFVLLHCHLFNHRIFWYFQSLLSLFLFAFSIMKWEARINLLSLTQGGCPMLLVLLLPILQ